MRWVAVVALFLSQSLGLAMAAKEEFESTDGELFSALSISVLKYVEWNGVNKVEDGSRIRVGVYDRTRGRRYFEGFSKLCKEFPDTYVLYDLTREQALEGELDLAFFAGRSSRLPTELIDRFRNKPVLLIGEHDDFLEAGGIIRFQTSVEKRAEFGINLKQARLCGLTIRSRLSRRAVELIR